MTRVLYGATIPAFATEKPYWRHWLANAEQITAASLEHGIEVSWLAVLQHDGRGRELFWSVEQRADELQGAGVDVRVRYFSVDPPEECWTSGSRLQAICTARNLIIDEALREGHDWVYFADSDISAPDDILVRLLELDWPVCGGHVPTYCLDGPKVTVAIAKPAYDLWRAPDGADVRKHWNTAGSLLVARDVFRRVPWRHDPDARCTDDPATQGEMEQLGWPTLVRHDVVCEHHPPTIGPLEGRGLDLQSYR